MIRCVLLAVVGTCLASSLTACGSSGSGPTSSAPVGAASSAPAGAASPSGSATPANTATLAAISRAYATFFDSTSTAAQSQAALQHGEKFTHTLAEQAKSTYASSSSAKVESAALRSPDVASVTFTITSGGSTLLSKAPGFAVKTGSTWQVAAQTFCGLLTLQGDPPGVCSDPAVTALPD